MEVPFNPLEAYRDGLGEAHKTNVAEAFGRLVEESGVDAKANAATCRKLARLERELAAAKKSEERWGCLGAAVWTAFAAGVLSAIGGGVGLAQGGGEAAGAWLGGGLAAAVAMLAAWKWGVKGAIARAKAKVEELQRQRDEMRSEAEAQIAPLNALFDWDMAGKLCEKTLPLVKFDPYFSEGRLTELRETFGWRGEGIGEGSVLWAQSGEINGNPFVIGRVVEQRMGTATYRGEKTIHWTESVRGSDGKMHLESRSQRLVATVQKPAPEYPEKSFLLFANEAAERLRFSREPSPMARLEPGSRAEERALKRCIKGLEKFARNLDDDCGFTMSDPEFEAYFQAKDRNDEVQFRVLYTVLAQRWTLQLLKDRKVGFGDDFRMEKLGKIHLTWPEHLRGTALDGDPARYRSHDLEKSREAFQRYNEAYFKHAYFALAPLLAVPLHQQFRSHSDIWGDAARRASASPEHEALANYIGEARFKHPESVTRNILKAVAGAAEGGRRRVTVAAHGFRAVPRVDTVGVWGRDGRRHEVEVPWKEYFPVTARREMRVVEAGERSRLACEAEAATGGDMAGLVYRRAVMGGCS